MNENQVCCFTGHRNLPQWEENSMRQKLQAVIREFAIAGKYSSDRDTLRVECKSAVFHADFLLLRLSRFGNSTGLDASS